ncbi:hypothetical protein GF407_16870 [candidate division KSB1 bacterium]|nr:hypothetical protein [candidate division KSB1 bacterium]
MKYSKCLIILVCCFVFTACENPFGNDKISGGRKHISGTIVLGDGLSPEGTFIYLEIADVYTRADQNGKFELQLPTTASMSQMNGVYLLVAFMGGYYPGEANVAIENGQIAYGQESLDQDGKLKQTLELKRALYVSSIIDPDLHINGITKGDTVRTTLETITDTLGVLIPKGSIYRLGGILLKEIHSGETTTLYLSGNNGIPSWLTVEPASKVISFIIDPDSVTLETGFYKVTPWVLPYHHPLLQRLYSKMGVNTETLNDSYLDIPFHRVDADFTVTADLPE